ncbi:uncharacterized protein STEHIDRAFT_41194, partial [Stereum hirsutum FP-91666 SS1]|uniref:uncharacterized protein n=1 Tax=Stereum hirsutum (strain FP-91666) TaxID=721885 RepID=UPI000440FB16
MLRQNMRQKGQSAEDAAYRTVLENLRFKKCTQADLDLMLTRVAGRGPNNPKIYDKNFRSVPIITGRNAARDQTNITGVGLFAADTGQQLTTFYSIDKFRTWADTEKKIERKRGKKPVDLTRQTDDVNGNIQEALWNLWPSRTEHHPGMLHLCKGMPVMIKDNQATELAVTNGAEAEVVDWTSHLLPDGKPVLDILFVKLKYPPFTIKIEGLPDNVVPIKRLAKDIKCGMNDDTTILITRDQI